MTVIDVATTPETPPPPIPEIPRFQVYRVVPECIDLVWPQCEPLLELAVKEEHGRFTTAHMYHWFKTNEQQLWVVSEDGKILAAGMLRFYRHPTGKGSSIWHLVGGARAKEWAQAAFDKWLETCHLMGITEMSIVGRRGWLRHVRKWGFKEAAVVLTREEV